jgi:sirohydrochlorin ferrochelatase
MTRTRMIVLITLLVFALSPSVFAGEAILILAPKGAPAWNAQMTDLAAKVNAQTAAEVVLGAPTRAAIAEGVERLAKRGATGIVVVPFFLSEPVAPDYLKGLSVPVRLGAAAADSAGVADAVLARAATISTAPANEILVVVGYGSSDSGASWVMDLGPSGKRLNAARRFALVTVLGSLDTINETQAQQMRRLWERLGPGGRILVVPMLGGTAGTAGIPSHALFKGLSIATASEGAIADEHVTEWLLTLTSR